MEGSKENCSPSTSRVAYPDLPQEPLLKGQSRHESDTRAFDPKNIFLPVSPPNIGRRRSTKVASLTGTPPRDSHSSKISSIFTRRTDRPLRPLGSLRINTSTNNSTKHTISPPCDPSPASLSLSCTSPSSPDSNENPLDDLIRATNLPSTPNPPRKLEPTTTASEPPRQTRAARKLHPTPTKTNTSTHSIRQSVQPPAEADRASSDEWTGDEDFFPRSTRRQQRMNEASIQHHVPQRRNTIRDEYTQHFLYTPPRAFPAPFVPLQQVISRSDSVVNGGSGSEAEGRRVIETDVAEGASPKASRFQRAKRVASSAESTPGKGTRSVKSGVKGAAKRARGAVKEGGGGVPVWSATGAKGSVSSSGGDGDDETGSGGD